MPSGNNPLWRHQASDGINIDRELCHSMALLAHKEFKCICVILFGYIYVATPQGVELTSLKTPVEQHVINSSNLKFNFMFIDISVRIFKHSHQKHVHSIQPHRNTTAYHAHSWHNPYGNGSMKQIQTHPSSNCNKQNLTCWWSVDQKVLITERRPLNVVSKCIWSAIDLSCQGHLLLL